MIEVYKYTINSFAYRIEIISYQTHSLNQNGITPHEKTSLLNFNFIIKFTSIVLIYQFNRPKNSIL